jgi:1,4-dihydroxy-2-naphthoate octaprenyltransferase
VFIYFGIVATVGSAYVQHLTIPNRAWWLGVATGFMACALLEANNLRDVQGDRASGKKTLAARMNRQHAPWLYAACIAGVFVGMSGAGHVVVGLVAILVYAPAVRLAYSDKNGRDLLPMLKFSARAQLQLGALVALLLVIRVGV